MIEHHDGDSRRESGRVAVLVGEQDPCVRV
jgi:hypothetical protein